MLIGTQYPRCTVCTPTSPHKKKLISNFSLKRSSPNLLTQTQPESSPPPLQHAPNIPPSIAAQSCLLLPGLFYQKDEREPTGNLRAGSVLTASVVAVSAVALPARHPLPCRSFSRSRSLSLSLSLPLFFQVQFAHLIRLSTKLSVTAHPAFHVWCLVVPPSALLFTAATHFEHCTGMAFGAWLLAIIGRLCLYRQRKFDDSKFQYNIKSYVSVPRQWLHNVEFFLGWSALVYGATGLG